MKKHFTLLFALLCASVMGWATKYCGEALESTTGATTGQTVEFTASKTGALETTFSITSTTSTVVGLYEAVLQNNGGGVLNGDWSNNSGWTLEGNTLSKVVAWTTYPTGNLQLHLIVRRDNSGGDSDIMGRTFTDIDVSAACSGGGDEPENPESTPIDWTDATTNPYVPDNSVYQIAGFTGSSVVNVQTNWGHEGIYVTFPNAVTSCSLGEEGCHIEGAGLLMYLTAFTAEETEVTVVDENSTNYVFVVHNNSVGGGGSEPEDPEPSASPYCNTEIGHLADPSADANSFILLSVGSDGHGHTIVNIKQDEAKNSAMFDYINIVGKKDIGADVATGGADEMAIVFNTPTPDGDGNITFTLQWSTISWGGRWQINDITLPADATCASADPFPGEHTYCKYTDNDLRREGANVTLTWATNNAGDVVITLADGEGAHNTHFRNEGFEYGGGKTMDDSWFVYSGTNHATAEYASKYFTPEVAVSGGNTYALRLKSGETVPNNAVIAFLGHAFSWRTDEATNAYTENKIFAYTYGAACLFLDAPTNVAVDGTKHITFNTVANAESYTAHVYLDGILKHRQNVSSGDALTFVPYTTGTYQVEVTASAAGYPTSDPSDAYNWALTADPVVVGNSEYCEWALPTFVADAVDCKANLTIETSNDGSITITLSPLDEQTAVFREQGMKLSDFKVGEVRASASEYFNRTYTEGGSTVVLTLKDQDVKPGLGEKIYFSGYVECTVNGTSTWPTANLTYTYGSKCSGQKHVTVDVNNNEMGSATVNGEDDVYVDAETQVTCVAVANSGYDFVNWTVSGVEVSTLATYTPTIFVNTDLVANFEAHRNTYCRTAITDDNGATVYMTAKATGAVQDGTGYPQYRLEFEGMEGYAITGAGNFDVWIGHVNGSSGNTQFSNGAWTFVDNPTDYPYGMGYIEFYAENWREITFPNHYFYFAPNGVVLLDSNFPAHINWANSCTDETAPVLAAPSAVALDASTIRLTLSATDDYSNNIRYHVTCEAASIDENIDGVSGVAITKDYTGLTAGTAYTFVVTAADGTTEGAHVSASQSCSATPVGDTEAPVITSFTATPSYGYVDLAITATDDMVGNLTYTITYGENQQAEAVGAVGSETTKRIFTTPNTSLSFSVVATDAASHSSEAANASATTLTIPAAPAPTHNAQLVYSIYSNAYTPVVAQNFLRSNYGGPAPLAETDYLLYRMTNNTIVWGSADQEGSIHPTDQSYTDGEHFGLDVTNMTYLHFDIWCDASDQLNTLNLNDNSVTIATTRTIAGEWVSFDVPIANYTQADKQNLRFFKFHTFGSNCLAAIDNVYFYNMPTEITFEDDATDNSDVITANADKIANVTINRAIAADNTWYTLCLPFDMSAEKVNNVFGASTIATLVSSEDRGSIIHLNFDYKNAIEAGKPYLIKVSESFISGSTISDVMIKNVDPSAVGYKAVAEHMHFQGTFDKIKLEGADKRYVSANNTLYSPNSTNGTNIGAFRCYFTIPNGSSAGAPGRQAKIVFGQQTATGCENVAAPEKPSKIMINGTLYILRDGKTYTAEGLLIE